MGGAYLATAHSLYACVQGWRVAFGREVVVPGGSHITGRTRVSARPGRLGSPRIVRSSTDVGPSNAGSVSRFVRVARSRLSGTPCSPQLLRLPCCGFRACFARRSTALLLTSFPRGIEVRYEIRHGLLRGSGNAPVPPCNLRDCLPRLFLGACVGQLASTFLARPSGAAWSHAEVVLVG